MRDASSKNEGNYEGKINLLYSRFETKFIEHWPNADKHLEIGVRG